MKPRNTDLPPDCRAISDLLGRIGDKWSVDGLITRTVFPTIPPRVDYALTPLGRDLLNPVSALSSWAIRNQSKIAQARAHFDGLCKAKGKPPLRRAPARGGLVLAAHKT